MFDTDRMVRVVRPGVPVLNPRTVDGALPEIGTPIGRQASGERDRATVAIDCCEGTTWPLGSKPKRPTTAKPASPSRATPIALAVASAVSPERISASAAAMP